MSRLHLVLLSLLAAAANLDRALAGVAASSLGTGLAAIPPSLPPYVPPAHPDVPNWRRPATPFPKPPPPPKNLAEWEDVDDEDNDDLPPVKSFDKYDDALEHDKQDDDALVGKRRIDIVVPFIDGLDGNDIENYYSKGYEAWRYRGKSFDNVGCAYYWYCDEFYSPMTGKFKRKYKPAYLPDEYDWSAVSQTQIWNTLPAFPSVIRSSKFGGFGRDFDDTYRMASDIMKTEVQKITLHGGGRLTGIQFHYTDGSSIMHGKSGERHQELVLANNDYVVAATFRACTKEESLRICSAAFLSNKGKYVEFGDQQNESVTQLAPDGYQIVGLFGSEGDRVDAAGCIAVKKAH